MTAFDNTATPFFRDQLKDFSKKLLGKMNQVIVSTNNTEFKAIASFFSDAMRKPDQIPLCSWHLNRICDRVESVNAVAQPLEHEE
jgi:hypothetical protein